jgi:hypothetical protein
MARSTFAARDQPLQAGYDVIRRHRSRSPPAALPARRLELQTSSAGRLHTVSLRQRPAGRDVGGARAGWSWFASAGVHREPHEEQTLIDPLIAGVMPNAWRASFTLTPAVHSRAGTAQLRW